MQTSRREFRRRTTAIARQEYKRPKLLVDTGLASVASAIDSVLRGGWRDLGDVVPGIAIGLGVALAFEILRWCKLRYNDAPFRMFTEQAQRAATAEHTISQALITRRLRSTRRDRRLTARLFAQHGKVIALRDNELVATADLATWLKSVGRWFGENEYIARSRLRRRFPTEVDRFLKYGKADLRVRADGHPWHRHTQALITAKAERFRELAQRLQQSTDEKERGQATATQR